jgi:hypothetical protein
MVTARSGGVHLEHQAPRLERLHLNVQAGRRPR